MIRFDPYTDIDNNRAAVRVNLRDAAVTRRMG